MAYVRTFNPTCQARDCTERASVELCSSNHLPIGHYCLAHGDERLRQVQELEDRARRPMPPMIPPLRVV